MRIGFFVDNLNPQVGGAAAFTYSILMELIKNGYKGHEFYFFHFGSSEKFPTNKPEHVKYVSLGMAKNPKFKFIKSKSLDEACKENKIELFWHLSHPENLVSKIPYIVTVWDLQHRIQPYFPEVSYKGWTFEKREEEYNRILPKASFLVTGNNTGKKHICELYNIPEFRVKTIDMPLSRLILENADVNIDIKSKFNILGDYLFYPAQFWAHKNHIRILKALKLLNKKGINLSAVFTGSDQGNLRAIKKKAEELGVKDRVKFLGFVKAEELVALYKNAFCLSYASFFGPDNIPPLEAMLLECPVISSNADGMEEQLQDCALFFNPKEEAELADRIEELYNNKELKAHLLEKGKNLVKSKTPKDYFNKMLEVMNDFGKLRECW